MLVTYLFSLNTVFKIQNRKCLRKLIGTNEWMPESYNCVSFRDTKPEPLEFIPA